MPRPCWPGRFGRHALHVVIAECSTVTRCDDSARLRYERPTTGLEGSGPDPHRVDGGRIRDRVDSRVRTRVIRRSEHLSSRFPTIHEARHDSCGGSPRAGSSLLEVVDRSFRRRTDNRFVHRTVRVAVLAVLPVVVKSSRKPQHLFDPSTSGRVAAEVNHDLNGGPHHRLDRAGIDTVQ